MKSHILILSLVLLCGSCSSKKEPSHVRFQGSGFITLVQTKYPKFEQSHMRNKTRIKIERAPLRNKGSVEVFNIAEGVVPLELVEEIIVNGYAPMLGPGYGKPETTSPYVMRIVQIAGVTPEIRPHGPSEDITGKGGIAVLITTIGSKTLDWSEFQTRHMHAISVPGEMMEMSMSFGSRYPEICKFVTSDSEYIYRISLSCENP